jgi:hypothetical protein
VENIFKLGSNMGIGKKIQEEVFFSSSTHLVSQR